MRTFKRKATLAKSPQFQSHPKTMTSVLIYTRRERSATCCFHVCFSCVFVSWLNVALTSWQLSQQPHTAACPTESPSICFQILSLHVPFRCHLDLDTRCGDLTVSTQVKHLQSTGFFFCVCLHRKFFALFCTSIYIQLDQTFLHPPSQISLWP